MFRQSMLSDRTRPLLPLDVVVVVAVVVVVVVTRLGGRTMCARVCACDCRMCVSECGVMTSGGMVSFVSDRLCLLSAALPLSLPLFVSHPFLVEVPCQVA